MSTASFLGQMGIAKMGKIGDAITGAIINFDPETASQAQIAEFRSHSNEIAARVAKAETEANNAGNTVAQLTAKLERDRTAARALKAQMESTTDEVAKASILTSLKTIVAQMKEIGGDEMDGKGGTLAEAASDAEHAKADLVEWQGVHQQSVAQLTQAETQLKHAAADMERAARDKAKALERQRQIEADANLRTGAGNGIALDVFARKANKMREDARAATIQADAIKSAKGGDADSIVAAALANAAPVSTLDADLAKI